MHGESDEDETDTEKLTWAYLPPDTSEHTLP